MTKITPKIGWVQWKNPYVVDSNKNTNDKWDYQAGDVDLDDDEDDCDEDCDNCSAKPQGNMKVVLTPMGAVPLPEHSAPQKVFNLWEAHTNFDITRNVLKIVEQVEGVETLDVFSRYRMRVGIGKMFDTKSVIRDINNNLYKVINQDGVVQSGCAVFNKKQ